MNFEQQPLQRPHHAPQKTLAAGGDILALLTLALQAGDAIMAIYHSDDFGLERKDDGSPVTKADREAESIIKTGLNRLNPAYPIIAEEDSAEKGVPTPPKGPFWLVDPLDGTREFLARNDEFTVNIGLLWPSGTEQNQNLKGASHHALLGIIYAPALGELYYGGPAIGSWRIKIPVQSSLSPPARRVHNLSQDALVKLMATATKLDAKNHTPPDGETLTIITSRRHGSAEDLAPYIQPWHIGQHLLLGSSLKLARIAEAKADIYPRMGRTMEWDTAAGDAIVQGVGGQLVDKFGKALAYGKHGFANPSFLARHWSSLGS